MRSCILSSRLRNQKKKGSHGRAKSGRGVATRAGAGTRPYKSGLFGGFGVNGDALDAGEFLADAIFQGLGNIVDAGNRQVAIHGAMAGDHDLAVHAAHFHFVAIHQLRVVVDCMGGK